MQCHKIQVAFGMLMVTFCETNFHQFRQYIQSKLLQTYDTENVNDKTILLQTPCESLNLLFSLCELEELHRMLEQADTEMKTQKMLQLFHV